MRKFFSIFIVMIGLFSFAIAEDSSVQENVKNSAIQQDTNEEDSLSSELLLSEVQETRHPAWVGWVFGASEFAIDVYSASNMNSGLSTITFSFGPRFNFNKMSASTISDEGFSIAGRLGLGVGAIDNFHTTGFAMPIELEASYTIGEFTTSAGFSFLIIPSLENIKDIANAGVYLDLGWAQSLGAMTLRLGYIFHSTASLDVFGNSVSLSPLDGSFNFGFRWQI